ncbi:uncharacterized protein LOC117174105 isoform X2 [Belonocnema kinseyi]|uniref:uncharacterized protein LOC117174105 isoform X2 n=1 Tax=Belonocnema kinseyi TaxID=2817044 RepID=UPI00143D3028|nr:uncharacterized protein LOC117174105 isoform X2 [Belonocnema kinseyi]
MENEHPYELRSNSRSRSQTPQVLSRTVVDPEGADHHYDLRNRSRDRSQTPGEVTSSRRSNSRSLPASAIKNRERSMEAIAERADETLVQNDPENKKETPENATVKKVERRSERQRVKRQIFANGQTESKENAANAKIERKRKSLTPRRALTSDYSSEDGDREDPPSRPGSAYEIYKKAGEWWNVFPKTDYTYSRTSQCRYEIAPGVLAMPNMSRRSIHSDCSSTHGSSISNSQQSLNQDSVENNGEDITTDMGSMKHDNRTMEDTSHLLHRARTLDSAGRSVVYKTTQIEQYRTHREVIYDSNNLSPIETQKESRYKWNSPVSSRKYGYMNHQADSDTELDEAITRSTSVSRKWRLRISETSSKIFSIVTTLFYGLVSIISLGMFRKQTTFTSHDYRHYHESRWSRFWKSVDRVLQYIYLLFVKVLFLDSWLLSRASNVRRRVQGRRKKVLWLIFLPLLLAAGFWFLPRLLSTLPYLVRQSENVPSSLNDVSLKREYVVHHNSRDEELRSIVKILADKVEKLENGGLSQNLNGEHLENVTRVIEDLKRNDESIWNEYDKKLLKLEEFLRQDIDKKNHETISAMKVEFQALRESYLQLKSCCDSNACLSSDEEIEIQVDRVLAGYFGSSASKEELSKVIQSLLIMHDNAEIPKESLPETVKGDVSLEDMRKIVKEILKIYDADKTGRVDYALESAGGQVISTRCTQRYDVKTRAYKLLGLTLYYESNNPRTVIQGNNLQPGTCWAFQDFPGYLLVKLRSFIYVTGFTLEHAPKSILPNGDMRSAPRKFNVWGLKDENDPEPVLFGDYEFVDSEESLQYFPVQNTSIKTSYEFVELRIHSNHGQLEYTCLYRFRVHGRLI